MYTKNNLNDINYERARVIDDAITELMKKVVRGTPYTARDLSVMTGGIISTSIFEKCLSRGYHILRRREERRCDMVAKIENKYSLFADWRAKCDIHKEGTKLVTIKEYDEEGNLISEYRKRRGRGYYTATF